MKNPPSIELMPIKVSAICTSKTALEALGAPDPARTGVLLSADVGSAQTLAERAAPGATRRGVAGFPGADEQAMEQIEAACAGSRNPHGAGEPGPLRGISDAGHARRGTRSIACAHESADGAAGGQACARPSVHQQPSSRFLRTGVGADFVQRRCGRHLSGDQSGLRPVQAGQARGRSGSESLSGRCGHVSWATATRPPAWWIWPARRTAWTRPCWTPA